MQYEDLSLNQKIAAKGLIQNDPQLGIFKAVWVLWNFKVAVNELLKQITS